MAAVQFISNKLLPKAFCDSEVIKRANTNDLRNVFTKYASVEKEHVQYMTVTDFIQKFLGMIVQPDYDIETLGLLAGIVDQTKDQLISFEEFQAFESLLCAPDALYMLAFQLFDTNGSGFVSFGEFRQVFSHTMVHRYIPFSYDCEFVKLHFGNDKKKELSYGEFTNFLQAVQVEHVKQAFLKIDTENSGFISPLEFKNIMSNIRTHLLSTYVADNIVAMTGNQRVSFAMFSSFNSLLTNMEVVKRVYKSLAGSNPRHAVSKDQFLRAAQPFCQITPIQVDLLFKLSNIGTPGRGFITLDDVDKILPREDSVEQFRVIDQTGSRDITSDSHKKKVERSVFVQILESGYRFALGSIAGACGATAVYPIDLVKTRMQNQRSTVVGEILYKNSFDCFKKVIRFEGFFGLYRGLPPQLIGVCPEKAIKLTMNDFVRDKVRRKDGSIPMAGELFGGACAGASQVVFTNPLEIVKIRLQIAGEMIGHKSRISAITVIRELGFFGLYKGARACFLRDIPFSAIYFPAYAHLKTAFSDDNGHNSPLSLLTAGTIAGAPAAYFTTPADVIKTRLQVVAREGQTKYTGVWDCTKKIMAEEGPRAFWKGGPARIFRSSPQFGVTLVTYEVLQRALDVDFGGVKPEGSDKILEPQKISELPARNPDHIGGLRLAAASFAGIETKFGLCLPKFRNPLQHRVLGNLQQQ